MLKLGDDPQSTTAWRTGTIGEEALGRRLKELASERLLVLHDRPGVLCFVDADWPLIGGAFAIREVEVLWPKRLYSRLAAEGSLEDAHIRRTHRDLAAALPCA